MKRLILAALCLPAITNLQAQTLFTYGTKPVSKQEFLKAFDKNPTGDTTSRATALKNYLDLYINYKLKVQAAYDEHLNTSEEYKNEAENFKNQLADVAINNEANLNNLVDEAFLRGKKDIELQQIFIPAATQDTATVAKKINEAYAQLKAGKSFNEVANQFVPKAQAVSTQTPGYIGFVTVFSLPYNLESNIYALQKGEYTTPYHSTAGYHIFKVLSERPAVGKRKVQQILFAAPQEFSSTEKVAVKVKADSVYQLLKSGASFSDLQNQFSSKRNYADKDIEVSVGQYDSYFETQVFALAKPGDVSAPFATAYGYNILKLTAIEPAAKNADDITARAQMQEKVEGDDRLAIAKQNLVKQWQTLAHYTPATYNIAELWKYTDSSLQGASVKSFKNINSNTVLFSFTNKKISVTDWLQYIQMARQQRAGASYAELMKQYETYATTNYYKAHIEDYNATVAPQAEEFNNANLLFAAMDKHVWTKAAQDSVGLLKYYTANKAKYQWAPGVSAVVVNTQSKEVAAEIAGKLKENPADWRQTIATYGSLAQADSSRFEKDQLPVKQVDNLQPGYMSAPEQNGEDAYTFIYVTKTYNQPEPRSFDDARGLVINDYQLVTEDQWLQQLKKKYPVVVNKQVWAMVK